MEKQIKSKCKGLLVAAMDCGATVTRYALSWRTKWSEVTTLWIEGHHGVISFKAPTCLLLRKDFTVSKFGLEAEYSYSEMIEDRSDELNDFYFFQGFRIIFQENVSANKRILFKDINGNSLEASLVLPFCIEHFKCQVLGIERRHSRTFEEKDVEFVLSIPAVWGEKGKIVMREAATKAGLDKERFTVILGPEAVSIYCQYAQITENTSLGILKPGTKYVILDLGASVEITVHQKCEDNSLEELLPSSTGPWGVTAVKNSFIDFLTELVGESVIENMKENYMYDYLDLMKWFTATINTISASTTNVTFKIPAVLLMLCEEVYEATFREIIAKNKFYKDKVRLAAGDRLRFKQSFFTGFFKKTVNSIVKQLDELFEEKVVRDVDIVIIVGELSSCFLVQNAIRTNFEEKKIFVPENGDLAAIHGAVLFGHVPGTISRRPSQYTYGFQSWPEFSPGHHPEQKKVNIKGSLRCRDVFFKVVRKGENIMPGCTKSQILEIPNGEECLKCCLFFTDTENTKFIDEPGCKLLGVLRLPLSAINDEASFKIEETLIFGESELEFRVKDVSSGVQHKAIFDLFEH